MGKLRLMLMHVLYCIVTGVYNVRFHLNKIILQITLVNFFFSFSLSPSLRGACIVVE